MRKKIQCGIILILILALTVGCKGSKKDHVNVPDWSVNATMYEVNIRQYTPEGTFKAFEEHLPRLQEMGIEILWLMPIYPISREKRIGSLGSYYAISDFQGINPEFGDKEDFKHLVEKCHEMGFKVMLDWVGNHTGWDNDWIKKNPEWYTKNESGKIIFPENWEDVADLNFDNKKMRKAMLKAMKYWVKEFDVDGYRCDYAGGVPLDFWETAREALNKIKPVYMLAEDDRAMFFMNYSFNSNYGWSFYHDLNRVAKGTKKASSLISYLEKLDTTYPTNTYPLHFLDNHDENSWTGTVEERLGEAQQALLALIFTVPGMPLIYSGQEVNLDHRLEFFDKDLIEWENFTNEELLTKLIHLKSDHPALWNGTAGGDIQFLKSSSERVLAYSREKDEDKIVVVLNLSDAKREFSIQCDSQFDGIDLITEKEVQLTQGENTLLLEPWGFLVIRQ